MHNLELNWRGQTLESHMATAKARELLRLVHDIEHDVDTRPAEPATEPG